MKTMELSVRRPDGWRKIAIALTDRGTGVLSVIAFHEKAGRSQVDSSLASLNKVCSPTRSRFLARSNFLNDLRCRPCSSMSLSLLSR